MAYIDHFKHADDVVNHLNTIVPAIADPLLKAKYVGFVSVVAVTVYEMAVKDIFIDFANKKHKVLGNFTESYFDRISGKIKLRIIKDEYIPRFGAKYKTRFQKNIEKCAKTYFQANHRDIKSSYGNLITWRNDFAHEGRINTTATYEEAVQAYEDGKEVIHCLAKCMIR
ncbi:HEPN domain-containing protein [Sedimenticola hydrogenitrophicus]|uniref:HEPN domain-containing protein n=1 Tax=Sedimenticola hydrogenitrophicus TaxID=2967975 RepID=UPI0021A92BFC